MSERGKGKKAQVNSPKVVQKENTESALVVEELKSQLEKMEADFKLKEENYTSELAKLSALVTDLQKEDQKLSHDLIVGDLTLQIEERDHHIEVLKSQLKEIQSQLSQVDEKQRMDAEKDEKIISLEKKEKDNQAVMEKLIDQMKLLQDKCSKLEAELEDMKEKTVRSIKYGDKVVSPPQKDSSDTQENAPTKTKDIESESETKVHMSLRRTESVQHHTTALAPSRSAIYQGPIIQVANHQPHGLGPSASYISSHSITQQSAPRLYSSPSVVISSTANQSMSRSTSLRTAPSDIQQFRGIPTVASAQIHQGYSGYASQSIFTPTIPISAFRQLPVQVGGQHIIPMQPRTLQSSTSLREPYVLRYL
eukprot:TRINITY_DN2102_c0_g1_i2.p1 TRINITY_DN2102_c0_g1~~TRINITY_DN2102_c0_g1_i2.p1  ORF type:complete len:365 (-),score=77.95 TRINITY_DN2102_c0_g1_i2:192-1286(-)